MRAATGASAGASAGAVPDGSTCGRMRCTFSPGVADKADGARGDARRNHTRASAGALRRRSSINGRMVEEVAEDVIVHGRREEHMRLGIKNARGGNLHLSRVFAGGHIFTESVLDKLLCEAYYNTRIIDLIELLTVSATQSGVSLYLRPVPTQLRGKRYQEVHELALRESGVHVIGLYRSARDKQGQPISYVLTNPANAVVVAESDGLFMLGRI